MFVVHMLQDGKANQTRDFGHVNQFFREYPLFRQDKANPVFLECVEQGFIYIHTCGIYNTYHKSLDLLFEELAYNRKVHNY